MTTTHSSEEPTPVNALGTLLAGLADDSVAKILARGGLLNEDALRSAKVVQEGSRTISLLGVLLRSGAVPEQAAMLLLSRQLKLPLWSRSQLSDARNQFASTCAALQVSENWCKEYRVAFLGLEDISDSSQTALPKQVPQVPSKLTVLFAGTPGRSLHELLLQLQCQRPIVVSAGLVAPSDFAAVFESQANTDTKLGSQIDLQHLKELAEEGPVVELVNSMLSRAVSARASDVHLEPADPGFTIRLRVDGRMRLLERYNSVPYEAVVCRVKILSGMDIAERRLPQDGRLDARVNGMTFDVRVSAIPMVRGESVVLRLLRQERIPTSLQDLGLSSEDDTKLRNWLSLPNGLILVTGPTGSGKSTTLYTAIDLLGRKTDKIVTVEDPVEYKLAGVSQIQVNAEIGLDFPQALRSILRHDPDVIMVGEIRDSLTAQIATQAALTGHLVLSTLHTNTAAGAVTRLLDMGVDAFLLADSLKGVMAQRLVRRLCPDCKRPADGVPHALYSRLELLKLKDQHVAPMQAVGCTRCDGSGYDGRLGIYDLITFDSALAEQVCPGVTARILESLAHQAQGTVPWADGWRKVASGATTAEEILATTSDLLSNIDAPV